MSLGEIRAILKETAVQWYEDEAPRQAASLAYYALLSAAPLVLLCIAVTGMVFGEQAARGEIAREVGHVVGEQAALAIQSIARNAHEASGGVIGTVIGLSVLLAGASGVFGELQSALNKIWNVKQKPGRGIKGFLRDRLLSFTLVLGVAFMLLVSLIISTALAALGEYLEGALPGGELVWHVLNFALSLGVITVLFGLIFKVIPDVEVRWRDVGVGAAITALLFTIGKMLLGLYLGKSTIASSYGAAGSIVALVVWVYYASQILFLGAEFTQVYARKRGAMIRPSTNAVSLRDEPKSAGAQQLTHGARAGS